MNGDAQPADLLLDRRQDGDDGRQRVLVLGHESPDVLDVRACPLVVARVALDVLDAE